MINEVCLHLNLIKIDGNKIILTNKGRLSVEEIACQFEIPMQPTSNKNNNILEKHNFIPRYSSTKNPQEEENINIQQEKTNPNSFFANHKKQIAVAFGIGLAGIAALTLLNDNDCPGNQFF